MTLRTGLLAAVFCLSTGHAMAQGCPPADGEAIAEVENLNALMIKADFAGIDSAMRDAGISDPASVVSMLSSTFPNGFVECTTLLQRSDAGTVAQSVVVFTGGAATLYVYFRTALIGGKFYIINLYLNTDEGKVFERVF